MVPAAIGQDALVPRKLSLHPLSDAVLVVTWGGGGEWGRGEGEREGEI
jgi:hypothetical protein